MGFEDELWRYTDVYDRTVLLGPVPFAKLRALWKLGRVGPGTTVSNETWLLKPTAIKRVKGLMTALSQKGGPGAGAESSRTSHFSSRTPRLAESVRRRSQRGGGQSESREDVSSPRNSIYDQLWYCQMSNGEVVGPLKTKTLHNLWLAGRIESQFLVRAKSLGQWPSDRTYTVEGLMKTLQHHMPTLTTTPIGERHLDLAVPEVPAQLRTVTPAPSKRSHRIDTSTPYNYDEEATPQNSTIKEVVITLPEHHHHHHHSASHRSRRVSHRERERAAIVDQQTDDSSMSYSSATSVSPSSPSSSSPSTTTSPSEATSSSAVSSGGLNSSRVQAKINGLKRGEHADNLAKELGLTDKLEEAKAEIKRLQHCLDQSEREKIQAREVALSLRTMLVEQKKHIVDSRQQAASISSTLPKSPLVENSIPEQDMELKKLSNMSTDKLFSYANSLRAENEKLLSIRSEIVDAHKTKSSEAARISHPAERSTVTPVPFNISPGFPVSAARTGGSAGTGTGHRSSQQAARAEGNFQESMGFASIPPVAPRPRREEYESNTRSVHAESLVGPAYSPFGEGHEHENGGMHEFERARKMPVRLRTRRDSESSVCDCVKEGSKEGALMLDEESEREIDLFLTPKDSKRVAASASNPAKSRRAPLDPPKQQGVGISSEPRFQSGGEVRVMDFDSSSQKAVESSARGDLNATPSTSILDDLQRKVEALSRSVEKSREQSQSLQKSMIESKAPLPGSKQWSKDINPNSTRYQAKSAQIHEKVESICDKFKQDGFHLPLSYMEGFGYSLGGKKIHLAVFGKKLHIRFGGGYIDFMDYLSQKKIPLQTLGRTQGNA